jgi:PAS domain S-box-containing protein
VPDQATHAILIVEDDAGVAGTEMERLEKAGFKTSIAKSAAAALAMLRSEPVSLIVLNHNQVQGIDGLEFCSQLRASGIATPIIVVSKFGNQIIRTLPASGSGSKSSEAENDLPEAVNRVLTQSQVEQRLAESEARLTSIIKYAKDAILVAESDETISLFNPAAERMFGCTAAEAMGQPLKKFFRKGFAIPLHGQWGAGMESLTWQVPSWTKGVRADGDEFPIEASTSRCKAAGRNLHTLLVRDITDRRRAEAQILEQAALLDNATDAIMVCDMDDCITYWNRGAARLYGWSNDEAYGQPVRDLLCKPPYDAHDAADRALLEHGEWTGELRQFGHDGRERIVDSRWTLMRDETMKPKAKLVIDTDITERKKMEGHLLRSQRLESLGTLAGGIAHDLNNMLTPITIALELLRRAGLDENGQSMLAILQTSIERGTDLVRQILAFARSTPGQCQLLMVKPLINELSKLLRQTFPKNITIDSAVEAKLWNIQADATQVHQILMNLCVNSRDAMPGGGRLRIAADNIVVDDAVARLHQDAQKGPHIVLTIQDTGTGIAPDLLEKIFDPFFTTKAVGFGTGLGLATVAGIVRIYHGFVRVYSELGKGTQFKVFLPAAKGEHVPRDGPSVGMSIPTGKGQVILLIDDEAAILQLGRSILEANGYRVLTAANGKQGVDLFPTHRAEIKLVLTDWSMPQFDGRATVRALRAMDERVPIIMMSGLVPEANGDPDLKHVQGCLAKPYTADTLLTMVQQALGSRC